MPNFKQLKKLFSELSFPERVELVKRNRKARREFVDTRKLRTKPAGKKGAANETD